MSNLGRLSGGVGLSGPVDAKSFANLLLTWADSIGVKISPMKLQKLIYYCHADFLVQRGFPLVDQEFEAWEYGPVIPSIFHEFKKHGSGAINSRAHRFDPAVCGVVEAPLCRLGDDEEFVKGLFDIYVRYSASALSNMSHSERGPWAETLRRFAAGSHKGRCIENRTIEKHHRRPIEQSVH